MTLDYYIVDDPETVSDGITLGSGMIGVFYNGDIEAREIREKLKKVFNKITDHGVGSFWESISQASRRVDYVK